MTAARPVVLALATAALVAGCGGSKVTADEVPGDPMTLTLPSAATPEGAADSGSSSSADADASATPTATSDSGASGTTTTPPAATTAPQATATPDPANTGGAGGTEGDFNQFCEENPGAC